MRTTQRKGDIATTRAIASFTAAGWDVSLPVTESAAYDLIVDLGQGQLKRVQCKFMGGTKVGLRRIHSNSTGYQVKYNADGDYDWLYVLGGDGREYLIKECLSGRNSVSPRTNDLLVASPEGPGERCVS